MTYVLPLSAVGLRDIPLVGGKNASLGEMARSVAVTGAAIPDGFVVTVDAFAAHLDAADLRPVIIRLLGDLDVRDVAALQTAGRQLREHIREAPLPAAVVAEVTAAYAALSDQYGDGDAAVAVRSSATAEDLPGASFAGQHDTFLDVSGADAVVDAVRDCMASLFTDRAIVYRTKNGFRHEDVSMSVGVQKMVRSDLASAGVIFTLHPETGFRDLVVITGAWGLGESVVQGRTEPDEFWVFKPTLAKGKASVIRRELGNKQVELVRGAGSTRELVERSVPMGKRDTYVLNEAEVLQLARWAVAIEDHTSAERGQPTPMDIEWAKDGLTGELFIVQARPETVHAVRASPAIEMFRITGAGEVLLEGKGVGARIGVGRVRVVRDVGDLSAFQPGEVLVAQMTDPDWEPVLERAAAVVTERGGRTCHAAIVARELGLPCIVGATGAIDALADGTLVTVASGEGGVGKVYWGEVPFEVTTIDPTTLPTPPVPLMLNLANPDLAFQYSQLPVAGVGLLRTEFVVSNWIGVHPMAAARPDLITHAEARAEIARRAIGHDSPAAFFVDRLATGIAQIAAAFYPRPVVVRTSDFKTDEYARLLGGEAFEEPEANPMLGFRGAARYTHARYEPGFALECEALRRARQTYGLDNIIVMIPFCRTPAEGRRVLAKMAEHGLERGVDGLQVYVMTEIPNNVILVNAFAALFDGFSIGSNDLTQLTLGIDRSSELMAPWFDEQDPGMLEMIRLAVRGAHRHNRPIGLCGQAPSDRPEFATFLMKVGIDTISLTPDAVPAVATHLAKEAAKREPRARDYPCTP